MTQIDASIPLSVKNYQMPDLATSMEKALNLKNMQQTNELNDDKINQIHLAAMDSANMKKALATIDPNDPDYDTKALSAMHDANVSPEKMAAFKKDHLASQLQQATIDEKKQQASKAKADAVSKMNETQLKVGEQANNAIYGPLKDTMDTYNSLIAKAGPNPTPQAVATAKASAETIFKAHASATLEGLAQDDPMRKAIQAEISKPFNIDEINGHLQATETAKSLFNQRKNELGNKNTESEIALHGAQAEEAKIKAKFAPEEARATIAEKNAGTQHLNAETQKLKTEETIAKNSMSPTGNKQFDTDLVSALARSGTAADTPRKQQVQNQQAAALHRKYPDATGDDIAAMITEGKDSAKYRQAEDRVVAQQQAKVALGAHEILDAGGFADQVKSAAKNVDMGKFKSINDIELYVDKHKNDTNVITLNNKLQALKNAYIQVAQRGGSGTEGSNDRADHIINTAMGKAGINAAVDAIVQETKTVQTAGKNARADINGSNKSGEPTTSGW